MIQHNSDSRTSVLQRIELFHGTRKIIHNLHQKLKQ